MAAAIGAVMSVAWGGAAEAARSSWASQELLPGEFVNARLIASAEGVGDLETIPAGLHIRLPEGWKTYWRSPGEAGLPPAVDWTGSRNADVRFDWPAPHRFTLFGIDTFGYDDEVVFPLAVTPREIGQPVSLAGRLDLLVCSDICVPAQFDLSLELPAGSANVDPRIANLIDRFASIVPEDGVAAGLSIDGVTATDALAESLVVRATAREPFVNPDLFVEAGIGFSFAAPNITFEQDGRRLRAEIPLLVAPGEAAALTELPITVTLIDGGRTLEWSGTTSAELAGGNAPTDAAGFAVILLLAVLGGFILNLMPCVLPVLSLKLVSVLGHGGGSPRAVRMGFLATAAGIVASFMVLAGVATAAKLAGGAVGWGIQFQQPVFLIAMIVIITAFACNLLGFFEILLPSAAGDAALKAGDGNNLAGHFGTGAFATLLATPCSAPFLGTAVGFALSRGPLEIFAVFLALGIGLALPYLAVAAAPRLATMLPRPGPWIITMKRVLSGALIATALWLLSVLLVQSGAIAAALIGLLMLGMGFSLWRRKALTGDARLAGGIAAVVLAIAAFLAPLPFDAAQSGPSDPAVEMDWVVFDRSAIGGLVAGGQVVFVDVTADWCLTCQANKQLVLQRGAVAERLGAEDVVPMQADWTLPDDAIANFLASYGRYGIPFYVVYGPGAPDGLILPELLSSDIVLDAVEQARHAG